MATLAESIALDIARKWQAGINAQQIAQDIVDMPMIADGLQLRSEALRKAAGRGLHSNEPDMDTREGQIEAAKRIRWVADFLDDGFNDACVAKLREVVGDLEEVGE